MFSLGDRLAWLVGWAYWNGMWIKWLKIDGGHTFHSIQWTYLEKRAHLYPLKNDTSHHDCISPNSIYKFRLWYGYLKLDSVFILNKEISRLYFTLQILQEFKSMASEILTLEFWIKCFIFNLRHNATIYSLFVLMLQVTLSCSHRWPATSYLVHSKD